MHGLALLLLDAFLRVKVQKADFAIFRINDGKTEVIPESVFPETEEDKKEFAADEKEKKRETNFEARVYPKFKEALVKHAKQTRFAVLDFRCKHVGGARREQAPLSSGAPRARACATK